jgi:hypothetical protein
MIIIALLTLMMVFGYIDVASVNTLNTHDFWLY